MANKTFSTISSVGCYIPTQKIKNEDFLSNEFYDSTGKRIEKTNKEIIDKFHEITTIKERCYVTDDLVTSDIAYFAAKDAIEKSNIDIETFDYIIVAHNFGDITKDNRRTDIVPSIAARVKYKLKIKNPNTIAYDLPFGCPGWLQGVIQADYYIKSGDAKRILVIGADTLSRIYDPHDIDCMLYADGAGAIVLDATETETPTGILAHKTRSDTYLYSKMLVMDKSYKPDSEFGDTLFLKMNGRRLYQYALETVPKTIKECLDNNNVDITEISKVLIHQANGKMDDAILQRLFKLYGVKDIPDYTMPMTISWLGNSSVATIPTLLDMILNGKIENYDIKKGDNVVLASVGAGMNINVVLYKA